MVEEKWIEHPNLRFYPAGHPTVRMSDPSGNYLVPNPTGRELVPILLDDLTNIRAVLFQLEEIIKSDILDDYQLNVLLSCADLFGQNFTEKMSFSEQDKCKLLERIEELRKGLQTRIHSALYDEETRFD